MAERVVDVLEPIEVEKEDPEHVLVAPGGQQGLPKPVAEEAPVGKSGQRVVERLILESVGVRLALGDVAHCRYEQVARPDPHGADDELEREEASAFALAHGFVRGADRYVQREPVLQVVGEPAAMSGGDQDFGGLSDQLLLFVAEELHHSRVRGLDDAGLVDRGEPVGNVVQHRTHSLFAVLQGYLCPLALNELADLRADIVHHRHQAVVQLTGSPGMERDHADDAPSAPHREAGYAVQPRRRGGARPP